MICNEQAQPIGFINLCKWLAEGDASSWSYFIDAEYQGKGYGFSAVRLAMGPHKVTDPDKPIKLATEAGNETAQRLYAALVFDQLSEKDGDNLVFGL